MGYWYNTHNGMSDFRLYNQRLKCHEAHCHGNYAGSIWGCGIGMSGVGMCTGGGFWNGFKSVLGMGLGMGLVNLAVSFLGNIFGGGGLFGGGLFGGNGIFGGGGGLFGLGGNSGFWGLNGRRRAGEADDASTNPRKVDNKPGDVDTADDSKEKDYAKLNDYHKQANELTTALAKLDKSNQQDVDAHNKKVADLLDELDKYVKEENLLNTENETQISNIKAQLIAAKIDVPKDVKHEDVTDPENPNPGDGDASKIKLGDLEVEIEEIDLTDIENINDDVLKGLDDNLKDELLTHIDEILGGVDVTEDDWLEIINNPNIPSEIKAKAKSKFYDEGLTNVKKSEFTEAELKKLIAVIDKSEVDDFDNINEPELLTKDDNTVTSFKIKSKETSIEVTYNRVEEIDGELIFHGAQDQQQYVVQKDKGGNYKLMQYKYHKGYETPDVSTRS